MISFANFVREVAVHRKAWTVCSVVLLVLGVALFVTTPQQMSYVFTSRLHGSESTDVRDVLPPGFYWLPPRALLGVAIFVVGLVVLAATTAYAAGLRKRSSAAN